jgi:predicted permease
MNWIRRLFGRAKVYQDLSDEIRQHLDEKIDALVQSGMSREEATATARREFGNITALEERGREVWQWPTIESVLFDIRYALRQLRRQPSFTVVAILILGLGIGANTAVFSVVDRLLFEPLAFRDPDRLVWVQRLNATGRIGRSWEVADYEKLREMNAFEDLTTYEMAFARSSYKLSGDADPDRVAGVMVAQNFFSFLGRPPIVGRSFTEAECQLSGPGAVILSHSLWQRRYSGRTDVIGRQVMINDRAATIVGVMPASFDFGAIFAPGVQIDVYMPAVFDVLRDWGPTMAVLGRHKPGASPAATQAAINAVLSHEFDRTSAPPQRRYSFVVAPFHESIIAAMRRPMLTLWAAVGLVLLIVCINLANLLLSRVAARSREAAVRAALGASRGRQFRQVLTESLLLACCGGALGIVFAGWILEVLVSAATLDIPRLDEVRLDTSVLVFAVSATLLTGLLFGVLPAWRLTRVAPQEALRTGSHTVTEARRGLRLREGLIGVEVGLSTALLILAGLLTFSLDRLLQVEKGFGVDQVLTFDLDTAGPLYGDQAYRERFFTRLLARVNAIPGVEAAGLITQMPLNGQTWNDPIYLEDHGSRSERHVVDNRYASPGYFRAMNIDVLHGRAFDERDRGQGVAVLSKKAAQLLWPGDANPVGRTFMGEDDAIKTLVGIVADVRATLHEAPPAHAYYPYWQRVPGDAVMVVRTSLGPETAAGPLRAALHSEDPQLPIGVVRSMADVIEGSVAQRRFQSMLVLVFAASAMLVASLGIYGVVAYSVARRRNEIGIRMALGAKRSQLLRLIIRQGMTPVVLGLAAGIAAAVVVGRAIRGLLFEIEPADPLTIAAVALALLTVGLLACFIPARRATGPNTVDALRFE